MDMKVRKNIKHAVYNITTLHVVLYLFYRLYTINYIVAGSIGLDVICYIYLESCFNIIDEKGSDLDLFWVILSLIIKSQTVN